MDKTNTAVLISIRPNWCELIASGKKTIEVRKTKPKIQTTFKCYIYCTQSDLLTKSHNTGQVYVATSKKYQELLEKRGNITLSGKVIGEFVCDEIYEIVPVLRGKKGGVYIGYDTLIEDVESMACLSLDKIEKYLGYNTGYGWHISELVIYDTPKPLSEFGLSRPPQSWCYVKESEQK